MSIVLVILYLKEKIPYFAFGSSYWFFVAGMLAILFDSIILMAIFA